MTVAVLDHRSEQATGRAIPALRLLVLARAATEDGMTRAELARDLGALLPPGMLRTAIDMELAELVRSGRVAENKARFRATDEGIAVLSEELSAKALPKRWSEMRDIRLVAKALGMEAEGPARIKALVKPDGLRGAILVTHFGFRLKGPASPSRLRADLALIALSKAFGDKLSSGISSKSGLNAKTARLLAGQLLAKPRDPGTDARLVGVLAAEVAGAAKQDADALRVALIKKLIAADAKLPIAATPAVCDKSAPAEISAPAGKAKAAAKIPAASRPSLEGFAAAVQDAAKPHAEGWPGNRKALINRVWAEVTRRHPAWGISAVEFKAMLAEAHRTGHLVLATADLKAKGLVKELQDSAISYKNTVWHLIRIQD